jgi:Mlc titration factor MtfA (ptsG expression regulator)
VLAATAIALAAVAVLAWLIGAPLLRERRRRAAMARPLPPALRAHVERNLPLRARLPAPLVARHDALVGAFLDEKEFVGCDGLEITDEIRATIAAYACLLVLGRRGHYDSLHSVLVYPTGFWVEDEVEDDSGVVERRRRDLSGEAWEASRIILSWEDVLEATHRPGEGYNVAVHEFAHHLEVEGLGLASVDGVRPRSLEAWSADLSDEYEALAAAVDRGEDTLLDPYGAEDPTEFFAVATEEFYDRPVELRAAHPRLYALLVEFYGIDPAAW